MKSRSGRILLTALACVALSAAGGAASTRAHAHKPYSYCAFQNDVFRLRHPVMGVVAPDVAAGDDAYRNCSLGRMAAYHLGYFRYDMDWVAVETRPNVFDWSYYDGMMTEFARHHIAFLPILGNGPQFRTTQPRQNPRYGWYPPRSDAAFAHFAALAVQRYGPHGTFWKQYPGLPYDPIRAWQIWNEPSLVDYWEPQPDPAAYTKLLQAAYGAIKGADPTAKVVTAGVPWCSYICAMPFYAAMFHDGAVGSFDAIALHDYAPTPAMAFARIQTLRRLMNRSGARRASLWITEFGWSAIGPPSPYRAGRKQAPYTAAFLRYAQRYRRKLGIGEIFYFDWRDYPPNPPPSANYWGVHTGLYNAAGYPRPVAGVVAAAAVKLDR